MKDHKKKGRNAESWGPNLNATMITKREKNPSQTASSAAAKSQCLCLPNLSMNPRTGRPSSEEVEIRNPSHPPPDKLEHSIRQRRRSSLETRDKLKKPPYGATTTRSGMIDYCKKKGMDPSLNASAFLHHVKGLYRWSAGSEFSRRSTADGKNGERGSMIVNPREPKIFNLSKKNWGDEKIGDAAAGAKKQWTGLDGLDEGLGRKDWNCWKTQRGRGELKERSKLQFTEMQAVVERAALIKD